MLSASSSTRSSVPNLLSCAYCGQGPFRTVQGRKGHEQFAHRDPTTPSQAAVTRRILERTRSTTAADGIASRFVTEIHEVAAALPQLLSALDGLVGSARTVPNQVLAGTGYESHPDFLRVVRDERGGTHHGSVSSPAGTEEPAGAPTAAPPQRRTYNLDGRRTFEL